MLKTRAVVLAKTEATYGVDPTPSAADNAILCEAPEFELLGKKLERNNVKSHFGSLPPVNVGEGLKISLTCELKGSGAAGTAPEIGPLLKACGLDETVVTDTSVTYTPSSDSFNHDSVAIYFYQHDILHKILGARGTCSIEAKAGEYAKISFEMTGLYAGPADDSIPTPTFNTTLPPVFKNASLAIDSYAAIIENLKADLGCEIARRPSANAATGILEYLIKERAVSGEIDPEAVALATKDFWSMWEDSDQVAFTATIGQTAGNICTVTAPAVVLDQPKYGDRENILTYALPLILCPTSSGDDEISLAFT